MHLPRLLACLLLACVGLPGLHAVDITRSLDKPTAREGATAIDGQFVVSRGSDSPGLPLAVHWQLGTPVTPATYGGVGSDFVLKDESGAPITLTVGGVGTVTIPADKSSTTIVVSPLDDSDLEGAEDVTIELIPDPSYIVGGNQSATITIADDDLHVSVSVPINHAYEDYTPGAGSVIDPDLNRRGVFRVNLAPATTFSTYIGVALLPGVAVGVATLHTDYEVVYKIGGNGVGSGLGYTIRPRFAYQSGATQIVVDGGSARIMPGASIAIAGHAGPYVTSAGLAATSGTLVLDSGLSQAVADNTALTITQPPPATGFLVNQTSGPVAIGATQVPVDSGSGPIPAGALVRFGADPTFYAVTSTLASPSGSLAITPGLAQAASDNAAVVITYPLATGFAVNQANSEPAGTTSLVVAGGIGGFAVGDVFRIGSDTTVQYLVTAWNSGTGIVTFTGFTGPAGPGGGTAIAITGTPDVVTHFPAQFSGIGSNEIRVLVPPGASRIEYGIVPVSDTTVEASEQVTMALLTSTDYKVVSATSGNLIITDDDVVVAFDPTQSQNATIGGTDGAFHLVLTAGFPRPVNIAYSIGGTAINDGSATGDLVPLSGLLVLPPNTTTATIPVHALPGHTTNSTLTLTLVDGSDDYRVVTTPGATQNASATISINHPLGTISIDPKVGSEIALEKPLSPVPAVFTVSAIVAPISPVTVSYTVSGTATEGSDYAVLSRSVTLDSTHRTAEVTITPLDDQIPDAGETVTLTLQTGQAYLIDPAHDHASITINDDEPVLSIAKTADLTEGDNDVTVFTVSSAAAVPRDTVVDLAFSGTAVAADRTVPTSVTILQGTTSIAVKISAIYDGLAEGDESLIATISDKPLVYTKSSTASATATIHDFAPTFTLTVDRQVTEGSATHGRFKIVCTPVPPQPITVAYTVAASSTATAGAAAGTGIDYKTLPLTVDVAGTDTFIEVEAFADAVYDPFETVTIVLTDASPATFTHAGTAPLSATMNILDGELGIIDVTSSNADRVLPSAYVAGDLITIAVAFSADVVVTGTPTLLLETGGNDATATYVSSTANTVTFSYVVRATDLSADLEYASTTALAVSGGAIRAAATPFAVARYNLPAPGSTGSLSANKDLAIDGGSTSGKPAPGTVGNGTGGGCGLGSGFAALAALCMLAGLALSVRRPHG